MFLWLSSDVGKLLQVMDVPCMGCGELYLVNGGNHHGGDMELMGELARVREDEDGRHGGSHHALGKLQTKQLR